MKTAIKALEIVADEVGRIEGQEELLECAAQPAPDVTLPSGEISVAPSQTRKGSSRKPAGSIVRFEDHLAQCKCLLLTQSGHFDAGPTSNSITSGVQVHRRG